MYLLDQVKKLENGTLTPRSYLISNQKIQYVNKSLDKWNQRRLNLAGFVLNKGNVMTDDDILGMELAPFQIQQRQLLQKGCTTVVVFTQVNYERQMSSQLKKAKHQMTNSSLDFLIGLKMPIGILRPTVIRNCQKNRVPVLKVQVNSVNELNQVPWTHIAQAMLTYPVVLLLDTHDCQKKEQAALESSWNWYCRKYRIPTDKVPNHQIPWSKPLIQKTGLYPLKGELIIGSDTDYMLFLEREISSIDNSQALSVDESTELDYDEREPNIVVLRGRILKVNDDYSLVPGYGCHIQVIKPGRFVPITEAHGNVESS
ncbi:hypothetical protein [Halalkalibacter urbisdiaboli]|uniref:hypothetical protein n=1 Tax=Halalkalibacter urbisdiaboli TaxID=1960589 RepID=UPI000B451262|nr:hypothetical protein [Halalkalibacter urbisdiaboli]